MLLVRRGSDITAWSNLCPHAGLPLTLPDGRGLLHKGVGLCHGIAGSGYALLSLHRATGDTRWRARAEQVTAFGVAKLPELRKAYKVDQLSQITEEAWRKRLGL